MDQGTEGACVGFGWTGFLNARPVKHEFGNKMGFDVYHRAQQLDEWEGEDYSGTSVRAGAKVLREREHINAFAFTQDAQTLARFVSNREPTPIGVSWHEGMDRVDSEGYIYPTGRVRGGHCIIVDGVVFGVKGQVDRFRLRNSWGSSWGLNGRCRMRIEDLQRLFSAGDSLYGGRPLEEALKHANVGAAFSAAESRTCVVAPVGSLLMSLSEPMRRIFPRPGMAISARRLSSGWESARRPVTLVQGLADQQPDVEYPHG